MDRIDRTFRRRTKEIESTDILRELMTRQYLKPHAPLADVLTHIAAALGLTLGSVRGGADRFEIDTSRVIGRLKRVELEHLSRLIHCSSRHTTIAPANVV